MRRVPAWSRGRHQHALEALRGQLRPHRRLPVTPRHRVPVRGVLGPVVERKRRSGCGGRQGDEVRGEPGDAQRRGAQAPVVRHHRAVGVEGFDEEQRNSRHARPCLE